MGRKWITHLGLALAFGGAVHACRSSNTVADSAGSGVSARAAPTCSPGRLGCPCASDGEVTDCGTPVGRHGDYVTCAMGRSTCEGGRWGVCVGDTLVTKSVHGATLGPSGLRTLATTVQCPSGSMECLCDPYLNLVTTSNAGDVDAAGIVATLDAALTLEASCPEGGCPVPVASNCPDGGSTTLVGTVRDPAGINPVYNAYVYVPSDPSGALPPQLAGASCGACAASIDAVAVTQTGPDGSFVLTNVPSTDTPPGSPVPLVVQVGKWRREVMLTQVPMCQTTTVDRDSSRLPRNQSDGAHGHADIPKMAIATGADPVECALLKIGLDPAEFQLPGKGTRSIDYYVAKQSLTQNGPDFGATGGAPPLSSLVNSAGGLITAYDVILLPCEGFEDNTNEFADNVSAFANAGGRVYTSHHGYTWLATPLVDTAYPTNPSTGRPNPFYGVANWSLDARPFNQNNPPINTTIDVTLSGGQPFPKGQAFASWAQTAGASSTPGQLSLSYAPGDVNSVIPPTTAWLSDPSTAAYPYLFSFNTPVGGGGGTDAGSAACGRVAFFDFHPLPLESRIGSTTGGQCNSNSDCGFTATCISETLGTCAPVSCTTSSGCGDAGNYQCSGTPGTCLQQTCTLSTDCSIGTCVQGVCGCTSESQCAGGSCVGGMCSGPPQTCSADRDCGSVQRCVGVTQGVCKMSCSTDADCSSQGSLCVAGQCQGCRDQSYCPSQVCNGYAQSKCSASSSSFPLECKQGPLSPEEKAFEFMLFDLSACISPDALPPPVPSIPGAADAGTIPADAGPIPLIYQEASFNEDFTSTCPQGTRVVWRSVEWDASIPNTASIDFSAETADMPPDGGTPDYSGMPILLATATPATADSSAYIDTGTGSDGGFNTATPPVISRDTLRLIVTLHPTSDGTAAPTLSSWRIRADCLPAE